MNEDERREQYAWMHAHGYTHVPLAVSNDYPLFPQWAWDWWNDPDTLNARLVELYDQRLIPVLVLHPRGVSGIETHLARVRGLWPAIAERVVAVQWGWEINDLGGEWGNGTALLHYLDELRGIVGDVPIYVHFTPERWSGWPSFDGSEPDKDEVAWLRRAREHGAVGLLYQEPPDKPLAEAIDRALEIPSPHGWSPGICGRVRDGAGMDFILFEFSRNEARHAEGVRRLEADGRVQGYG